jgi:hypothetical protein
MWRVRGWAELAWQLLDVGSSSIAAFIGRTKQPGSIWNEVSDLNSIHEGTLDKELTALGPLAKEASINSLHVHMASRYKLGGLLPDPDDFEMTFSAAIEFLRSAVSRVRRGLCQEDEKSPCCTKDEGGPFETAL